MAVFASACANHFSQTIAKTNMNQLTGEKTVYLRLDLRSAGGEDGINLELTRSYENSNKMLGAVLFVKGLTSLGLSKVSTLIIKADDKIYRFDAELLSVEKKLGYGAVIEINPQSLSVWTKISKAKKIIFQGNGQNSSSVTLEASDAEKTALLKFADPDFLH